MLLEVFFLIITKTKGHISFSSKDVIVELFQLFQKNVIFILNYFIMTSQLLIKIFNV